MWDDGGGGVIRGQGLYPLKYRDFYFDPLPKYTTYSNINLLIASPSIVWMSTSSATATEKRLIFTFNPILH